MSEPATETPEKTEIELAEEARRERKPIPAGNGLLAPERWAMFGRIANTVNGTEFVPAGLRGKPEAIMACLLYGDAQGLHPSVALTEIHIVDGKPTMSATLMVGMIRAAGHRIKREEIRNEAGTFVGCIAHGTRGDDGETDSFTFDLMMAQRAGLLQKNNWRNYPEAMCWARCVSQLARMLFPDVFLGQSTYTSEELGLEQTGEDGAPIGDTVEQPKAIEAPATTDEPDPDTPETQEQHAETALMLEVRLENEETGGSTLVGSYAKGTDPFEQLDLSHDEYEIAGMVDGGLILREKPEKIEGEVVGDDTPDPDAEPAEDADVEPVLTLIPADKLVAETIPAIMEHVVAAKERGDVEFLKGVLEHENAGRKRVRLVAMLEDEIALLEELGRRDGVALRPVAGRDPEDDREPAPFAPAAAEPEPTPARAVVAKITAASGWLGEHKPNEKGWSITEIVASAAHIWGTYHEEPVKRLEDLSDEELEQVWAAVPGEAKEALALVEPTA